MNPNLVIGGVCHFIKLVIHVRIFFIAPATQRVKFLCVAGPSEVDTRAMIFSRIANIT